MQTYFSEKMHLKEVISKKEEFWDLALSVKKKIVFFSK
jgi:hypothetical protein